MSPNFGRSPCPDNLIQIEVGPSLENLVKEIRYSAFYQANPGQILKQSMLNNTFEQTPLGGDFTQMAHGYDNPNVMGFLPDIHPCGNSTEEKHCDSAQIHKNLIENLKEEANSEDSINVCYIITGLLLLTLIIAIICKINGM